MSIIVNYGRRSPAEPSDDLTAETNAMTLRSITRLSADDDDAEMRK